MAKKFQILVFIILEYPLVIIANKIAPTNEAGLGIEIPLMFLFIAFNLLMIVLGSLDWSKGRVPKLIIVASIISLSFFWHFWKQP
jgi:hypothetical protein